MNLNLQELKDKLCHTFCTEVKLYQKSKNLIFVETPFIFEDGDIYSIYIKILNTGIFRISDCGHTLMHLSYENDIDKFKKSTRGKLFEQIFAETEIQEINNELYLDSSLDSLITNLFRFGQAITKICDLTFLNQARAESTFYDDLWESLIHIVNEENIIKDFIYPNMNNASDYPIDYLIETHKDPLYVFGIPNRDKARLATIILEHFLRENVKFDSLLIFADQRSIGGSDLARLSNVGGEMIASLDAQEDLRRKIERRLQV